MLPSVYHQLRVDGEKTLFVGDRVLVERIGTFLGASRSRAEVHAWHRGRSGRRLKKQLYRNGQPVHEPYAQHSNASIDSYRDNFPAPPNVPLNEPAMDMLENHVSGGELMVPPGHYFVMGDNREDAADSRYFGFIQHSDIIGRPLFIYGAADSKRAWTSPR
ncbi:MAG: signal peptidase I [Ignavibacteriota bacterium]